MSFATLMVHVDIDGSSDARTRLAANLADRFSSTLIGISASALPMYPAEGTYFVSNEFLDQEREDIVASLKKVEDEFRKVAGADRPKLDWRCDIELPDDFVISQARAADLVIVGRDPIPGGICRSLNPGTAVVKAGRPVLVVPPRTDALKADRVVIGWKESREARRAVQDALPLLHEAQSVSIIEVCRKGMADPGRRHVDDVAQYLTRHQVAVGSAIAVPAESGPAKDLIRLAREQNADLIVAGGYGHSRLGEWIFGGVTKELLASTPVCCLLTH